MTGAVFVLAAIGLLIGASTALVSLLLSTTAVVLSLLVLRGERRRDAALQALLERLGREAGVVRSQQDR